MESRNGDKSYLLNLFNGHRANGTTLHATPPLCLLDEPDTRKARLGSPFLEPQSSPEIALSPATAAVLREARRTLGRDFTVQEEHEADRIPETTIAAAVDKTLQSRSETLSDMERADVIVHLQKDLTGWGILQPLIDDRRVTDIHVYDYRTVISQHGKFSERTGLQWPSEQSYHAFLDRVLLRLGKALSTQQHTVDGAFPDGIRVCAIDESVCVSRGPFFSVRIPRMANLGLDNLIALEVAPPEIINYLAALTRSAKATIIISGETGTGKTTLLRCLGTQFQPAESIENIGDIGVAGGRKYIRSQ